MNELTLFNAELPRTKAEQKTFVAGMVETAKNGTIDLLKAHAQFANIKDVIEAYLKDKDVQQMEMEEIRRYEKETAEVHNAKFEIATVGVKYDYAGCGYEAYNALCRQIDALTERRKEMEEEMKLHKESWVHTDKDSGDCYEVYPPKRTCSASVKVTINK